MSSSLEKKLKFYAEKQYNVLLEGKHGVGKTAIISSVIKDMGWNLLVLNSSTIDPYTDFIGVPTRIQSENEMGKKFEYLDMVLPKQFALDEVDAIFLDEINRGRKETLNGLLDLIQHKTIKNKKLSRLKVVWAAQNPYDDSLEEDEQIYNVKPLDPALKDRFHIFIDVPFKLNKNYLNNKYNGFYKPFAEWWVELPEDLQFFCSPRRLDYAMDIFQAGGGLEDVLNKKLPIKILKNKIQEYLSNNKRDELKVQINTSTEKEAIKLINLENIFIVVDLIKKNEIDIKYLKSINTDFIEHYLISNNDSEFASMIDTYQEKNPNFQISTSLNEVLKENVNKIDEIISNNLKSTIKTDAILNNKKINEISNMILKSAYEIQINSNDKVKLFDAKQLYLNMRKNNYFKIFENQIIEIQKEYLNITKSINELEKENATANTIANMKLLSQLQENLLFKMKNIFDLTISKSNHLEHILFGYIYYQIGFNFIKETAKYSDENTHIILSKPFKYNNVIQFFKKQKNTILNVFLDKNMYENELNHIFNEILTKSKSFIDFERNVNLNNGLFENLLLNMEKNHI